MKRDKKEVIALHMKTNQRKTFFSGDRVSLGIEKHKFKNRQVEAKQKIIKGYPILYNSVGKPYSWNDWKEIIVPGALNDVNFTNTMLLIGHSPLDILGKMDVNMEYELNETGLFIRCELPNTNLASDTYELIELGILDGMSFRFRADIITTDFEKEIDYIGHITDIPEITVTPFPAYPETVIVAGDNKAKNENEEKDKIIKNLIETLGGK